MTCGCPLSLSQSLQFLSWRLFIFLIPFGIRRGIKQIINETFLCLPTKNLTVRDLIRLKFLLTFPCSHIAELYKEPQKRLNLVFVLIEGNKIPVIPQ